MQTGTMPLCICPNHTEHSCFSERGARPVTNFLRNLSALSNWHSVYTSAIAFIVSVHFSYSQYLANYSIVQLCWLNSRQKRERSINWLQNPLCCTWQYIEMDGKIMSSLQRSAELRWSLIRSSLMPAVSDYAKSSSTHWLSISVSGDDDSVDRWLW